MKAICIQSLLDAQKVRSKFNRIKDLRKCIFVFPDGKLYIPSSELIDDYEFTGLNNIDFILSEYYKEDKNFMGEPE